MKPQFSVLSYLYIHTAGAGNTGYATVYTTKRAYVMNLVAATANSIQFQANETLKRVFISTKCAAAGSIELSRQSTSQAAIAGLATPDVLGRADVEPVTTSGMPQQNYEFNFD
jgi:hypothetical protein